MGKFTISIAVELPEGTFPYDYPFARVQMARRSSLSWRELCLWKKQNKNMLQFATENGETVSLPIKEYGD